MNKTYVFIDASNLFYGGKGSLGWNIDYEKLAEYLKDKYDANKLFYFGGVETYGFCFDYLKNDHVDLDELYKWVSNYIKEKAITLNEAELLLTGRHLDRIKFYKKLKSFGYNLYLKPVKLYVQEDGTTKRKANCDVDMTFYLMKEMKNFDRVIILSGDGDFLPVLKYLRESNKEIIILARGERTAKEIRQFAGANFRDFIRLENRISFIKK